MAENTLDTRASIIESAQQEFFSHGFEGARLQKIADRIGVTKAMIHYYFNTKKELLEHVYKQSVNEIFGGISEILQKDIPLFKKIEQLIDNCLEKSEAHPRLLGFVITESRRKAPWLIPIFEQQIQLNLQGFDKELEKAAASYKISSVSSKELLLNIFSLCYYPILSKELNNSLFDNKPQSKQQDWTERKGLILDTILNWLTA